MFHAHLCFPPALLAVIARPSDFALLPAGVAAAGVCGTPDRRLAVSLQALPCALLPIAAACMTAEVAHDNAVICSALQGPPFQIDHSCSIHQEQRPSVSLAQPERYLEQVRIVCRACKRPFLPASYPCGVVPSADSLCPAQLPCSAPPPAVQGLDDWPLRQMPLSGSSASQRVHAVMIACVTPEHTAHPPCWPACGVCRGGMLVPAPPDICPQRLLPAGNYTPTT